MPSSPYVASPNDWRVPAIADWVVPGSLTGGLFDGPILVLMRYRAERSGPARLRIPIRPGVDNTDGVVLMVHLRGDSLLLRTITGAEVIERNVTLTQAMDLGVLVWPGALNNGDFARLRVRLSEPE